MGLTPITGFRGLDTGTGPKIEREVAPAFALDHIGRMEDDAYHQDGDAEERGLEEDGQEEILEAGDSSEDSAMCDDQYPAVSFFA